MSNSISAFVMLAISSLIPFVLGFLVRERGARGLVNGIDWERVSDIEGCNRFISNMMYALGLVLLAAGAGTSLLGGHPQWHNAIGIMIAVAVVVVTLVLVFGMLRYQDKPPVTRTRDGRR